MARLTDLKGKWALVTGASSGIGYEFCDVLSQQGCNLVMVSNQPKELAEKAEALKIMYHVETFYLVCDLSEDTSIGKVVNFLNKNGITPFVLINNAGIFDFKSVSNLSTSRINLYIDLHIRALTHLSREIGKMMCENGGGYILNMSSMSCWMPMPGIAMYTASKAYIRVFSRAFRVEMKDRGVSVMVACPGGIATDLFGLSKKLPHLGVKLGILDTPQHFAKKALKRTLKGKTQYINGLLNRISIVAVALLPEWGRIKIKKILLNKVDE